MVNAGPKIRVGPKGDDGIDGQDGLSASVQIGEVRSGAKAKVWNTGTEQDVILNFVLPKGDKGEKGEAGRNGSGGGHIIQEIGGTASGSLLSFFTKFSCGKLSNFDPDDFQSLDCCVLPNTVERQTIDLGELKDLCA